jgi:hypothetical protein
VGLDVSHHTRISRRGGEKLFLLTSDECNGDKLSKIPVDL